VIRNYFLRHAQVFFYTLGQLSRAPVASFLTVAVIGITLALPAGLYVAIENVQRLAHGWEDNGQISLFLKQDVSDAAIEKLSGKIRKLPAVSWVEITGGVQFLPTSAGYMHMSLGPVNRLPM